MAYIPGASSNLAVKQLMAALREKDGFTSRQVQCAKAAEAKRNPPVFGVEEVKLMVEEDVCGGLITWVQMTSLEPDRIPPELHVGFMCEYLRRNPQATRLLSLVRTYCRKEGKRVIVKFFYNCLPGLQRMMLTATVKAPISAETALRV